MCFTFSSFSVQALCRALTDGWTHARPHCQTGLRRPDSRLLSLSIETKLSIKLQAAGEGAWEALARERRVHLAHTPYGRA
jgi:hypothetical protein